MKKIFLAGIVSLTMIGMTLNAQVGINTFTPKVSLHVKEKADVTTFADGIIAPQLTGAQLKAKDNAYTTDQTDAIVYVTDPAGSDSGVTGTKTIHVAAAGYYYFDGAVWQPMSGSSSGAAASSASSAWYVGAPLADADAATTASATSANRLDSISHNNDIFVHGVKVGTGDFNFSSNTAVGNGAMDVNDIDGSRNDYGTTDGIVQYNTAIGNQALNLNTSSFNTAVGYQALNQNYTSIGQDGGGYNTAVGAGALLNGGDSSVAVGYNALSGDEDSRISSSVAVGNNALSNGGNNAVAVGNNTGAGNNCVAVGYQATSTYNGFGGVAVGYSATGSNGGVAVGYQAKASAQSVTAVGYQALMKSTGASNSAFGLQALQDNQAGTGNSAFGSLALQGNQAGIGNSAFGTSALKITNAGSYNSAFGFLSLSQAAGNYNVGIGYAAGKAITTGTNNIVIGANQDVLNTVGSNQLNIGGAIFGTGLTGGSGSPAPAGNIGIGTVSPGSKLEINGAYTNTKAYGTGGTTIDFSQSNLAYTTVAATSIDLQNIKDGGVYKLAVTGTNLSVTTGSFLSTGYSFRLVGATPSATNSGLFCTFTVMGTTVYYTADVIN